MVVDGRSVWASPVEIGPKTRGSLVGRLNQLNEDLSRRSPATVLRAIVKLLSVMKMPAAGPETAAKIAEEYVATLADLPSWAVVQACEQAKRRGGASEIFAPTTAELHRMAQEVAEPFLRERRQLSDLLNAKPFETPRVAAAGSRERVEEGFGRLRSELAVSAAERAMADRKAREGHTPTTERT